MSLPLQYLKDDIARCWNSASDRLLPAWKVYPPAEQLRKEREIDHRMKDADVSAREGAQPGKKHLVATRRRLQKSIVQFLHSFDCAIGEEMEGSFSLATDDFIRRAYDFNPSVAEEDVYQASRNVLIMNTFQMYLHKKVHVTPSVFAYSMLYPVTDNYLDAADICEEEKRDANSRLRLRLEGTRVRPRNAHERSIDALVGMIEGEFDRSAFPDVYESLLAIHDAQCRSVTQQGIFLPESELFDISIEKGGSSVLADGYLVAGVLRPEDDSFFFRFGVLLQLIDDLQDIREDSLQGQQTLARQASERGQLEAFTNRLSSYMAAVVDPNPSNTVHRLISQSCRLLILEAAASAPEHFSTKYLRTLEQQSPVRFDYLRTLKAMLRNRQQAAAKNSASYGLRRIGSRTAA
jgi:hypothetical protein